MAMHLASMVHGGVRDREAFQHPSSSTYYQHTEPRGYSAPSTTTSGSSYSRQQPPHQSEHRHAQQQPQQHQRVHPQSPPSPPAEDLKPSLPSISSLLEIAGGEKAAAENAAQSPQSLHRQSSSPQPRQPQQQRGSGPMQQPLPQSAQNSNSRADTVHVYSTSSSSSSHRMTLPPTPPMHPDPTHDGNQSPSTASTHSVATAPFFVGGSLNNMEPHSQRQAAAGVPPMKRDPHPAHSISPYSGSAYATQSPYGSSPGAASATSFYSPEQQSYSSLGMYAQRPLPSTYQPQTIPLPVPVPTPATGGANPWQHHHYISTSSQSAFPQSQDRYICSTCNKAFSRPSSLRIHSHSHTGEKPYKCPQPGCGKAFSVRSNMKRHERGCHAAASTAITTS